MHGNDQPGAVVIGGHTNGAGAVRALAREGVVVDLVTTTPEDIAQRSRYVRHCHELLQLANRPESLIELLDGNRDAWRGWAILPTNDHALSVLAKHHAQLSSSFALTSPPWSITQRVVDKRQTSRFARQVGIGVPRNFGAATHSFEGAADLDYPVLVKPTQGHGFAQTFGRKLFMVRNKAELAQAIDRVERAGFDCEILEYINGPDTCLRHFQVYLDGSGTPHGEFTHQKLRQDPPRFGVARACEVVDAPDLREPSLALLGRIGWHGIASIAYKTDARRGGLYLMEINGRNPLSHGLALRAGINYPLMACSDATSGQVRGAEPNGWRGVWIDLHADFFATIKNFRREEFGWHDLVRSYLGPTTFALSPFDDPGPAVTQWRHSLKRGRRRLAGRWPWRPTRSAPLVAASASSASSETSSQRPNQGHPS